MARRAGVAGLGAIVVLLAALPGTSSAATCAADPSLQERTVQSGGKTRSYWIALPANPPPTPRPLLVANHGLGSSGCAHAGHTEWSGYSNSSGRKFITVFPEATAGGFRLTAGNADVAYIRALVAQVRAQHSIDPQRIYASGHSNGAYFAQRLACDAEDVFASVTEYAGGAPVGACDLSRGITVGMYHGSSDNLVPISSGRSSRDAWASRESCALRSPAGTAEPDRVTYSNCAIGGGVRIEWTVLPGQGHRLARRRGERLDAAVHVAALRRVPQAMRRAPLLATLIAAALAGPAAPASAQSADERDCFWQGGSRSTNIAYPDLGAYYWVSAFPLPPGSELVFRGRYPKARYFSFNVYDPALQPTDGINDAEIQPDPGSSNPFLPGARRDAAKRSYTVRVVPGVPPAKRERNTIYLNAGGQGVNAGQIIYRTYVPDRGLPSDGGVGVPEVSMKLPGGAELSQPLTCARRDSTVGETLDGLQRSTDGPDIGATPGPCPIPSAGRHSSTTRRRSAIPSAALRRRVGGRCCRARSWAASSPTSTTPTRSRWRAAASVPVMVLQGKAPTTPKTLDGRPVMGTGQVRYWSLCENEFASQRVTDCLYDEQVPLKPGRRFTIVMSTPGARPRNARAACGVGWMSWGAHPDGLLILRHMLPSATFAQAIQRVARVGDEEKVVGDYLPRGRHTSRAEFETRGCAGATRVERGPGRIELGRRSCLRRARVRFTMRAGHRQRLRWARVRVGGRRARVRIRRGRAVVRADLRRARGRSVRVKLVGRTVRGKRVRINRRVALCARGR